MSAIFWTSSHFQQWLLDRNDLLRLRQHDIAVLGEEDYHKILHFYCMFIHSLAKSMNMRQQVAATAQVYLRRFYCIHQLQAIDPLLLSVTALCLAAKVEEFGLYTATRMVNGVQQLVKQNYKHIWSDFTYTAQQLGYCEFYLLEAMDCCLIVYQPYRPLTIYANDMGVSGNQEFMDAAWRLSSECIRSDICLLYPPFMIALACLHTACALVCREGSCRHRDWFAELAVEFDSLLELTKLICHFFETFWRPYDEHSSDLVRLITVKQPKPRQQAPSSSAASSHSHMQQQQLQQTGGYSQQLHVNTHHQHSLPQQIGRNDAFLP